ncbi:MAG TPA: S8 family serine peptidase [Bacteroidia bacterium]|nr:S8 family serine peptidase [Bacteroidia bacterium]
MMKIKFNLYLLFLVGFLNYSSAQHEQKSKAHWVFFTDKTNVTFNPYEYFHKNTIERRINAGIPIHDSTDFPLNNTYVNAVKILCDSITIESRWMNAIKIWGSTEEQLNEISKFNFVSSIEGAVHGTLLPMSNNETKTNTLKENDLKLAANQLENLGLSAFNKAGITGKGIRVAMFDAGFPGLDKHEAFDKHRAENRIVETWNFLKKNNNVYQGGSHGTMTAGCVAGNASKVQTGLAVDCQLMLALTEYNVREPFKEEEYWLAAAEWADKNGADIISSSLGYSFERYFYKDMNGNTSLVAKAARMAVRKGMLVVNSAGNEYSNPWLFIITPADVDSVMAVGGIDPETGYHISFSSIGPNSKQKMKPNVCAFGHVLTTNKKGFLQVDGTSFACPLVSGFAACALQSQPNLKGKPMELFDLIQHNSSLYPYFDYMHGFGVPQAAKLLKLKESPLPTFDFDLRDDGLIIKLKEINLIDSITNGKLPVYYHIENDKGVILDYYLISAEEKEVLKFENRFYKKGQKLMVHYNGYTASYTF